MTLLDLMEWESRSFGKGRLDPSRPSPPPRAIKACGDKIISDPEAVCGLFCLGEGKGLLPHLKLCENLEIFSTCI